MSPMPQAQRWREEQMQGHAQEKIEDRMQGLASLGTPVKEVQDILNWVRYMSYERPRRPSAGLRHVAP